MHIRTVQGTQVLLRMRYDYFTAKVNGGYCLIRAFGNSFGGYQPCEKWLDDRKGRKLTYNDVQHWQRIVSAITETVRITAEIDALLPGWPLP